MITKRKDWKILLKWMRINMKMKMRVSGRKERKRKEKTNGIPVVVVTQSCPTPCDPTDCSPPGSSVHGVLQARILEWIAIPFSRGSSDPEVKPRSPALQADSLMSELQGSPSLFNFLQSVEASCNLFFFSLLLCLVALFLRSLFSFIPWFTTYFGE